MTSIAMIISKPNIYNIENLTTFKDPPKVQNHTKVVFLKLLMKMEKRSVLQRNIKRETIVFKTLFVLLPHTTFEKFKIINFKLFFWF